MSKILSALGLLVLSAFAILAQAAEPGFKLQTGVREPLSGLVVKYIVVTSLSDKLTVNSLTVNRGNCKVIDTVTGTKTPLFPKTLRYGESFEWHVVNCKEILEADVYTNNGGWTFGF